MNRKQPPWDATSGIPVLRLYKTKQYPNWSQDVNKDDLHPDWPQIMLLDLTADQFKEFQQDAVAFINNHGLYPEQPVKTPSGKANPRVTGSSSVTVAVVHSHDSTFDSAVGLQN